MNQRHPRAVLDKLAGVPFLCAYLCLQLRVWSGLKFAISTGILLFSNFPKPLYRPAFCQYCWEKSRASKRFPVALPTFLKPRSSYSFSLPKLCHGACPGNFRDFS